LQFIFCANVKDIKKHYTFVKQTSKQIENMTTLTSTTTVKKKSVEVKYSNMTFIVECYTHFMVTLNNANWARNRYTARIKETGENIGMMGDRKLIRSQMELINSKPHLFLNN